MFVVGLSNFLRQRNVKNFAEKLPLILNALVSILKYIQHSDSIKEKKAKNDPTKKSMQPFSNPELLYKFLSDASEDFLTREEERKQDESSEDDDDGDSDDDSVENQKLSRMDFDNVIDNLGVLT